MFQVVTRLAVISPTYHSHQYSFSTLMRLSWPQHLQTARLLEGAADGERGTALALMGISLLILAEDLLETERARFGRQPH